jgi:hypothetical protein
MKDAAQAVADAHEVLVSGLPGNIDPHVRAAVYAIVVREFLSSGYVRDLTVSWQQCPAANLHARTPTILLLSAAKANTFAGSARTAATAGWKPARTTPAVRAGN